MNENENKNSFRMVQIEPHLWSRLEVFFDDVEIPFWINDVVDNAIEDYIVTSSRVSLEKMDTYWKSLGDVE